MTFDILLTIFFFYINENAATQALVGRATYSWDTSWSNSRYSFLPAVPAVAGYQLLYFAQKTPQYCQWIIRHYYQGSQSQLKQIIWHNQRDYCFQPIIRKDEHRRNGSAVRNRPSVWFMYVRNGWTYILSCYSGLLIFSHQDDTMPLRL